MKGGRQRPKHHDRGVALAPKTPLFWWLEKATTAARPKGPKRASRPNVLLPKTLKQPEHNQNTATHPLFPFLFFSLFLSLSLSLSLFLSRSVGRSLANGYTANNSF
jgi:hypothetical protein